MTSAMSDLERTRTEASNGSATVPKKAQPKENIFLFIPNLIGTLQLLQPLQLQLYSAVQYSSSSSSTA